MEGNTLQVKRNSVCESPKRESAMGSDERGSASGGGECDGIRSEKSLDSPSIGALGVARESTLKAVPPLELVGKLETAGWGVRFRVGIVLMAVLWLVLVGAVWSNAAEAATSSDDADAMVNRDASDEYSFKWLDPEKKIYVLQNRRYTKARKLVLSVLGGAGFSNPYRNTLTIEPRAAYYFSEDFGFEVFYNHTFNRTNNTYKALLSTNTQVFPVIREIRSELGALAHWVPWYAKINVFNQILYFDWYFTGGAGTVESAVTTGTAAANLNEYVTQDKFALYLGTGHQYYLSDNYTVRLDFMGSFYQAPISGTTGEQVWFTNYNFGIGFGVRF